MTAFATYTDVANRWRPLSTAEQTVATTLCSDASALLRSEFPGIDAQAATDPVLAANLVIVTANMVKRAMVAPATGVSQDSETVGPYSHSQSYANPLGNVFLLAAERVLIEGYKPRARSQQYANDTCAAPFSASELLAAYDGGITIL